MNLGCYVHVVHDVREYLIYREGTCVLLSGGLRYTVKLIFFCFYPYGFSALFRGSSVEMGHRDLVLFSGYYC
jgi:hypothetical protein